MAFTQKLINVSMELKNGVFEGGKNSVDLKGLRISTKIIKAGGQGTGTMEAAIYGMKLATMNQLTTLGTQINFVNMNKITVEAGDAESGMAVAFKGTIITGFTDATQQPDVCFRVMASAGALEAVTPTEPTSVDGGADVATLMSGLATKMGLTFENNGVNAKLSSPYLARSPREQALEIAKAAGIEWIIDNGKLAIWNSKDGRTSLGSNVVSPETGMIGYPAFTQAGISVVTLFNKDIQPGKIIEVKSELTPACGKWQVLELTHELDTLIPNGRWFSIMGAARITGEQNP